MLDSNKQELFGVFSPVSYDEWRAAAEKALKGAPFDPKMTTLTYENILLKPLYTAQDIENNSFCRTMPGFFPFVRGASVDGSLKTPWLIAQEASGASGDELAARLAKELSRGASVIHIRLDPATKKGLDADNANEADVLNGGFSLSLRSDLVAALKDIDLSRYPLRVEAGASALPAAALFASLMPDGESLRGVIAADPIAQLATEGKLNAGLPSLYAQMAALCTWAIENAPELRTVLVDATVWHNAGGNAVEELAYAAATAVEYAGQMLDKGIAFKDFAKQVQFSFSVGSNLFMELAKIRAARLIWSRICAAYGEEDDASLAANIHVRTSLFSKTTYDPYVNLLRATTEAFAGAMGGADSMHVGNFDEPVSSGDDFSLRIARNIQIILQTECNLTEPVDPAGGSWYIESLTESLARGAWEIFQGLEKQGGIVDGLRRGTIQQDIAKVSAARESNLGRRKDVLVGTNMYPNLTEKALELGKKPTELDIEERRNFVKSQRSASVVAVKTMANAISAAKDGVSLGSIYNTFSNGVSPEVAPLNIHRNAAIIEKLRDTTMKYVKESGSNLKIFSANIGAVAKHKARADFIRGFFEVAAFEIIGNKGFETAGAACDAAVASGASITVICGADAAYPDFVPELARLLKEKMPDKKVFLAGLPSEEEQQIYKQAGVDGFIHIRSNCYDVLSGLQKDKGMTA